MFLPNIYTMPDGTKTTTKPKDGTVFYIWDANQNIKAVYQYDDLKSQWYDVTPTSSKPLYIPPPAGFDSYPMPYSISLDKAKCECGSEKTGSNRHSAWCQKYTEQS